MASSLGCEYFEGNVVVVVDVVLIVVVCDGPAHCSGLGKGATNATVTQANAARVEAQALRAMLTVLQDQGQLEEHLNAATASLLAQVDGEAQSLEALEAEQGRLSQKAARYADAWSEGIYSQEQYRQRLDILASEQATIEQALEAARNLSEWQGAVQKGIAELLGVKVEWSAEGQAAVDEELAGHQLQSEEWLADLLNQASDAMRPTVRGSSWDLAASTIEEVSRLAYLLNVTVYLSQRGSHDGLPKELEAEALGNWSTVAFEYSPGNMLGHGHLPTASGATPSILRNGWNRMAKRAASKSQRAPMS